MTALADISALINRATGGNSGTPDNLFWFKTPRVAGAAAAATLSGRMTSLWQYEGWPGAGAVPGAAAVCDNTTVGGLLQADPGGGRQKWLYSIFGTGLVGGTLILYDRLLHKGGLSGTTATAQDVQTTTPTPALTRYTNGLGNMAFAEIHTQIGASTSSIAMSYVDEADNTQSGTSVVIGNTAFREVQRAILLPPAAGDKGIKAVKTVTHATTGTAGAYGVVIGHPLAYCPIGGPGAPGFRDFATGLPGIPEILTDACLAFLWLPQTTTVPEFFGTLAMVEA